MGGLSVLPTGVLLTPLKQISHPKGDIFHAMTADSPGFHGFGEAYFSHILEGECKGWKRHRRMVLNLVVPEGSVRFHFFDEASGSASAVLLGSTPGTYARLTVPPGLWMAFSGAAAGASLVLNLASIAHDPDEAETRPLDSWPLAEVS